MGKIGKITSIKREYSREFKQSLGGSLADNGYSRFPGTCVRMVPWLEKNGMYRTGLDPEALYIKQMEKINPEEAAQERARVTELRDELESATGLDLSPRSVYYTKLFDGEFRSTTRARVVKLVEGVNFFNLDDPFDAITYAWLRVHEDIAPSYQAWIEGRVKDATNKAFFVDDTEYQDEISYKEKTTTNKAIAALELMSPEKRYKIARLLSLPVVQGDKEVAVYNAIDSFIKSPDKRGNKLTNVNLFNKITSMTDENLNIQFLVEEAFKYSIYRQKTKRIYEGEVVIADSKEDLIVELSKTKNQDMLLSLTEKIRQRKLQEV